MIIDKLKFFYLMVKDSCYGGLLLTGARTLEMIDFSMLFFLSLTLACFPCRQSNLGAEWQVDPTKKCHNMEVFHAVAGQYHADNSPEYKTAQDWETSVGFTLPFNGMFKTKWQFCFFHASIYNTLKVLQFENIKESGAPMSTMLFTITSIFLQCKKSTGPKLIHEGERSLSWII